MIVNSVNFLLFFLVIFFVYYFLVKGKAKAQNGLLLVGSYFFYGVANWKMIPLLFFSTVAFYYIGKAIHLNNVRNERKASGWTTLGTCLGIGILIYFKYLNFFIESFIDLFTAIGFHCNSVSFKIILPVGISFFTFKLIGYILDVRHQKMDACDDFIAFATYISFFPTLLSGPIDRANKFIPQLQEKRAFNYDLAVEGCMQIIWGMFLKMCIADRTSIYVNAIFDNAAHHNGLSVSIAMLLYPLQMYADFSGYSDMAIGVGKLLGLKVAQNFNYPFFGRNIAEYWRNWHMSLTSWLTDYVFMPLNIKFRDWGKWGSELAILITFVLIGMWHGALWTFALFGLYHGLLYIPLMLSGDFFKRKNLKLNAHHFPGWKDVSKMMWTYLLVALGLIIFRSTSLSDVTLVLGQICSAWGMPFLDPNTIGLMMIGFVFLFFHDTHAAFKAFPWMDKIPNVCVASFYIILIIIMGVFDGNQFIYFQF